MHRKATTAPWLLCCAAFLTACQSNPPAPVVVTAPVVERVQIPAALLVCQGLPAKPGVDATQRTVALFIADLWAAAAECADKLRAIREGQAPETAQPL